MATESDVVASQKVDGMKEFWDNRYGEPIYAYGESPNAFFQQQLEALQPGTILLPADGEGRNGVYAARMGWEVSCNDLSLSGERKARRLAADYKVSLHFRVGDFLTLDYGNERFNAVAFIFAHFPSVVRSAIHKKAIELLAPGGVILLEAFTPDHLKFSAVNPKAGGPQDPAMLYTAEILREDFATLDIEVLEEIETELNEGLYHCGRSAVVRMVARKPMV